MTRPSISVARDARGRTVVRSSAPIDPDDPALSPADKRALAEQLFAAADDADLANGVTPQSAPFVPDYPPEA